VSLPEPPEVLAVRARQILARCGYPDKPADSTYHFRVNGALLLHTARTDPAPDRWDRLAVARPSPLYFFYRQSPRPLAPSAYSIGAEGLLIVDDNPPPTLPGMAGVHLDPPGRLLRLYAVPPRRIDVPPTPADLDWGRWFDRETIGFDLSGLTPVSPIETPPCACDRQAAWAGTLPESPDVAVRVEAAAYRGRPVYFEVLPAGREGEPAESLPTFTVIVVIQFVVFASIAVLAVRNFRRGRGDVRGALRLGLWIMAVPEVAWLIGGHHTAAPDQIVTQQIAVLGVGGWGALLFGLSYLAMEPAMRQRWPWRITAWNRLLAGRFRDPMVGRDLLIGLALGTADLLLGRVAWLSTEWAGHPPPPPITGSGPDALRIPGPPTPLYFLLDCLVIPVILPVFILLLSFLFLLVLRREWLAWGATFVLFAVIFAAPFAGRLVGLSSVGIALALFWTGLAQGAALFALARFGLLAFAGTLLCDLILSGVPLTTDLSAWYAWQGVLGALVVIGLAGYGFVTATRGQRLFREGFFGDE
jgi:serine/threonine-protein kinase